MTKETMQDYIKNNKWAVYNQNTQAEEHTLAKVPVIVICAVYAVVFFCYNLSSKKLKVIALE
jgi:hypothetical protein